jgi:superfamily I DNA/RNA helicase
MPTVSARAFCESPFFDRRRWTLPAKRSSRLMTASVRLGATASVQPFGSDRCGPPGEGALARRAPTGQWADKRNLLYTGITRARKLVVLVGTKRALAIAVKSDKTESPFTQLAAQLGALTGKN